MKLACNRRSTSSLMARLRSSFILLGFCLDEELVVNDIRINFRHIDRGPREYIQIIQQKLLNKAFSWGCSFKPIRRIRSWWRESTEKDSGSFSVLLSWSLDSLGESRTGSSDSARESESWLSPLCDCYWSTILFCFLSARDPWLSLNLHRKIKV